MRLIYLITFFLIPFWSCQNKEELSKTHFNLGNNAYNHKNYNEAIKEYSLAIEANPKNHLAYFYRGCAKDELNDNQGAIEDFTESARMLPSFDLAYGYRASVKAKKLHDTLGALKDFDSANIVNTGAQKSIWYEEIGIYENAINNYVEAMKNYGRAISINPNKSEIYSNRASTEIDLRDTTNALNDCEHAIKLDSTNGMAHFNRGVIRLWEKQYAGSINDFNYALNSEQEIAYQIYYDKAEAEIYLKDFSGACDDLNKALELGNKNADSLIKKNCKILSTRQVGNIEGDGKKIFMSDCAPCHAISKPGDVVGPSLYMVTRKHSKDWISQFIINNKKLIDARDTAAMGIIKRYRNISHPKHYELNTTQVDAIIRFLSQGK